MCSNPRALLALGLPGVIVDDERGHVDRLKLRQLDLSERLKARVVPPRVRRSDESAAHAVVGQDDT